MIMKRILTILFLVALTAVGWWAYRLYRQDDQLDQAQRTVTSVMQLVDQGQLHSADALLVPLEASVSTLQREWAALPSIRRKEQTTSGHVANLRLAYRSRVDLTEATAVTLINLARQGKMVEAEKMLETASKEASPADENIKLLGHFLNRLKVQDFKGAEQASAQVTGLLAQKVPLSQAGAIALTNYPAVVQSEKQANYDSHSHIATEVKSLVDLSSTRESSYFNPRLKGKAMIWDATKDAVEMAYELLPDNLRASSRDGVVTIFTIVRRENILRGYYSISKQPGYKEKMTIGVIYWPAKVNAGTAIIWGGDPPSPRPVSYVPGYGSSVNIKQWIASLPAE